MSRDAAGRSKGATRVAILIGMLVVIGLGAVTAAAWRHFWPAHGSGPSVNADTGAGVAGEPCTGARSQPVKHIVVIVLENHDYEDVISGSPYLDSLASSCGLATNYWAITHPSLPNYIAMTSGQTTGFVGRDCPAGPGCQSYFPSIFEEVPDWKSYEEGMTANCSRSDNPETRYAVRHNPAVYYTRISAECSSSDVPFRSSDAGLPFDLEHDSLPAFSFVTPDLVHDEHDASLSEGDDWLRTWVPEILDSPSYRSGSTALFITYDEGTYGGTSDVPSHVFLAVVSPSTSPGTTVGTHLDHYSLLRTWQDLLEVDCLAESCGASSMASSFGLDG